MCNLGQPQRAEQLGAKLAMCCSKVKSGRILRRLNASFVIVGVLVILTCLVVSQQFAVSARHAVITKAQRTTDELLIKVSGDGEESVENGKVVCNSEGFFSESCEVDGDVRVNGTALSVTVVVRTNNGSERREWRVRPYAQRSVDNIKKVTVTQLRDPSPAAAPACTLTYNIPAVLFAIGGHSGRNYFHDFSDVLVPLFAASRRYAGEVLFLVSNIVQPRWLDKYEAVLRGLSKYDAVAVDGDAHVRCFPRVTVGLHIHKLLNIVPEPAAPAGGHGHQLTMADFTRFLRETYALPRGAAVSSLTREPGRRPRLMLLQRERHRRFVNDEEVARAAEAAGFEAVVVTSTALRGDAPVAEQARLVNSFDALVGVHGSGLTNAAFLPPGAVHIQVVPYGGMEAIARSEYGDPMVDMGLRYLEYSVAVEESTLLETLGPEHRAIKDPASVHRSGWLNVDELYLRKQDVRINVTRFAPTLARAFEHLRAAGQ